MAPIWAQSSGTWRFFPLICPGKSTRTTVTHCFHSLAKIVVEYKKKIISYTKDKQKIIIIVTQMTKRRRETTTCETNQTCTIQEPYHTSIDRHSIAIRFYWQGNIILPLIILLLETHLVFASQSLNLVQMIYKNQQNETEQRENDLR